MPAFHQCEEEGSERLAYQILPRSLILGDRDARSGRMGTNCGLCKWWALDARCAQAHCTTPPPGLLHPLEAEEGPWNDRPSKPHPYKQMSSSNTRQKCSKTTLKSITIAGTEWSYLLRVVHYSPQRPLSVQLLTGIAPLSSKLQRQADSQVCAPIM